MSNGWTPAMQPPPRVETIVITMMDDESMREGYGLPPQSDDMLVLAEESDGNLCPMIAAWSWVEELWIFNYYDEENEPGASYYMEHAALTVKWWMPIPPAPGL
jgi:hypothetical protein